MELTERCRDLDSAKAGLDAEKGLCWMEEVGREEVAAVVRSVWEELLLLMVVLLVLLLLLR